MVAELVLELSELLAPLLPLAPDVDAAMGVVVLGVSLEVSACPAVGW
jgi:hypothetical protein